MQAIQLCLYLSTHGIPLDRRFKGARSSTVMIGSPRVRLSDTHSTIALSGASD